MEATKVIDDSEVAACFSCGSKDVSYNPSLVFRGRMNKQDVVYKAPGYQCRQCHDQWATENEMPLHDVAKADKYRQDHGLLTSKEFEAARSRMGYNKLRFCKFLGVERMTYDRWLKGAIQSESMDLAVRLKIDESAAALHNLDFIFSQYRRLPASLRGNAEPSRDKLFNMVARFVAHAEQDRLQVGPLYLNKLCWYGDQISYNRFGKGISGVPYARLPFGPVIENYSEVFRCMRLAGLLLEVSTKDYRLKETALKGSDNKLTESDEEVIRHVWQECRRRLPQLANDSHSERGWKETQTLDKIDYNLSRPLVSCKDLEVE